MTTHDANSLTNSILQEIHKVLLKNQKVGDDLIPLANSFHKSYHDYRGIILNMTNEILNDANGH